MATFLMLSTLGPEGMATLRQNPQRLKQVNAEVEAMGAKVIAQWALLGQYDFATVLEAPDATTVATGGGDARGPGNAQDKDLARHAHRRVHRHGGERGTRRLLAVGQYHHIPCLRCSGLMSSETKMSGKHRAIGDPLDAVSVADVLGDLEAVTPRPDVPAAHVDPRVRPGARQACVSVAISVIVLTMPPPSCASCDQAGSSRSEGCLFS